MKAAFINEGVKNHAGVRLIDQVYGRGRRERLEGLVELYPEMISSDAFDAHRAILQEVEVIFSTWGFAPMGYDQLDRLPRLKAGFYAAGATGEFRQPLLDRGITVCSSTSANAIPVAEFSLAQILLAGAGYFRNSRECIEPEQSQMIGSFRGFGNFEERVAILGNGSISVQLQKFLAMHDLEVVVVPSRVEERTMSLEEAFSSSFAIVNLFPDREDNAEIYTAAHFEGMMDGAVFINAGRGRQVNERDLIQVMKERPDLTAVLDVQWPEPPVEESELYSLPNVLLSAHLAGSKSAELVRMADYMIAEFLRFEKGEPLLFEVQPHQL